MFGVGCWMFSRLGCISIPCIIILHLRLRASAFKSEPSLVVTEPIPSAASPDTPRATPGVWVMAVALFAFTLVLHTRHNDFPYTYHPDEGGKVTQVLVGSRNFHHPLLL